MVRPLTCERRLRTPEGLDDDIVSQSSPLSLQSHWQGCELSRGRDSDAARADVAPTLPLRADVLRSHTIFEELDGGITDDFLRRQTGNDDLDSVETLELQVDTVAGAQQLECVGRQLPSLRQLRLNDCNIGTIRDFGTGLARLQILWLCRSALQDIGGIAALLPSLQELYISFNNVRELSPMCMHETLQILDVEGNLIETVSEVESLQSVTTLRELTLTSNPLCKSEEYSREHVFGVLPHLEVLDDIPHGEQAPSFTFPPCLLDLAVSSGSTGIEEDACIQDESHDDNVLDAVEEGSQALRELRQRSQATSPAAALHPGPHGALPKLGLRKETSAVAELRSRLQELRRAPRTQESRVDGHDDPCEDDLVVEALKRSRPVATPGSRSSRSGQRPSTSFCPKVRGAWMSDCSKSTHRPTTAGSDASFGSVASAWSASMLDTEAGGASDLTAGEALVGSGLAAVRRRRRAAAAECENGLNIRDLMKRFDASQDVQVESCPCPFQADPEARRRRAALERLNKTSFQIRPITSVGSSRPSSRGGESAAIRRERRGRTSHSRGLHEVEPPQLFRSQSEGGVLDLPVWTPPTFASENQEVLLLE